MKNIIFICIFFVTLELANSSSELCDIEGLQKDDWKYGYETENHIKTNYIGPIETLKIGPSAVMSKDPSSKYLIADLKENILTVSTKDEFRNYSPKNDGEFISISIQFTCPKVDKKYTTLTIRQRVIDPNSPSPVLNQQSYEYNFAMPIPQDYDLSELTKIYASDDDVSFFSSEKVSSKMQFALNFNEEFTAMYNGREDKQGNYFTNLISLKEIKAPFHKSYTLNVKDKKTGKDTTAEVKINVFASDHEDITDPKPEPELPHPPVFEHHLYFANYTTQNVLKMDEKITIKYGAEQDTTLIQSGYEDYFSVTLDSNNYKYLDVKLIKPLSEAILKTEKLIVVTITATNRELHIPGKTALIICLPSVDEVEQKNENGSGYTCIVTNYNSTTIILLSVSLFSIISINLLVIGWFVHKRMVKNITN